MSNVPKVDVHHHVIPPELADVSFGLKGMEPPEWTESGDKAFSEAIGVRTSILSVSTPGVTFIPDPEESARVARSLNEFSAAMRDKDPRSYGFFATVPSLQNTELALRELRYAFDTLHADGVTLFTSYGNGNGYLGHPEYVPIWEELNARKAVVFVHPINNGPDAALFNEKIPQPAFDWPHETGRTALDMIVHRRLQQFPDVKIILSHAGGTLPALVARATLISLPEFGGVISAEDIFDQAKSFYFDTALSGSKEVLPLILGFAKKGHVLFGSDYPHATAPFSKAMTTFMDNYQMDAEIRKDIYYGAAMKLFPRLQGTYKA
ncbi:putative 6-methylsalicylic acid decarboxylase [Seiridium cardinale]|uniref:6-methylsalicylate decarboxylase n=1 Tax=Seiridium cardinale TaxID=138064 RepID=A0ABR2XK20_9PEZI